MQHEIPKQKEVQLPAEFETDAQRIVRRHLENENDVITDEDLRSVRIGIRPNLENASDDKMDEMGGEHGNNNVNHNAKADPIVPWDTIDG